MTGHRDNSAFDPNGVDKRAPLRPFTPTQWIGLAFLLLGAVSIVIYLLGRIGVIPKIVDDELPFVSFMPLGAVLMNSRRQTAPCNPQVLRGRRIMVIVLALLAAIGGAVLAFLLAKAS